MVCFREVQVLSDNKKDKFSLKTEKDEDRCFFLAQGSYSAHVILPSDATEAGIR